MNSDQKKCPLCAEVIKKSAVKCKFCLNYIDRRDQTPITADITSQSASDSQIFLTPTEGSSQTTLSRTTHYDLNEPALTGNVVNVLTSSSSNSQTDLSSNQRRKLTSKNIWIIALTPITLIVAITAWFYLQSGSVLQEFVNLSPQDKQVSFYEDSLKIKPIQTRNAEKNGKELTYDVNGCQFTVKTDENKNVVSYELNISEVCPPFTLEVEGLVFDSKNTTLKKILNQVKNCYSYFFRVEYVIFLGNMYDPRDLNYLELSGVRACNSREIIFTFPENEGIAQWKAKILDDYGGSDNLPNDQLKEINSDRKYNKLAESLWSDQKPSKIMIR